MMALNYGRRENAPQDSRARLARVRGPKFEFTERRTLNSELRIAPFSLVSRVPPVSLGYPASGL